MKVETYYIVSAECRQMKAFDGSVLTKEGRVVWLSEDGGYPSNETDKRWAKKFKSPPTPQVISKYDGMPWYFRYKPCTAKVYKVTEKTYEPEITEELLT